MKRSLNSAIHFIMSTSFTCPVNTYQDLTHLLSLRGQKGHFCAHQHQLPFQFPYYSVKFTYSHLQSNGRDQSELADLKLQILYGHGLNVCLIFYFMLSMATKNF